MMEIISNNIILCIIIVLMAIIFPIWGGFGMQKNKAYILLTIIGCLAVFILFRLQINSIDTDKWDAFVMIACVWIFPALMVIFTFLYSICISITPEDKDTTDELVKTVGEIVTLNIFKKKREIKK